MVVAVECKVRAMFITEEKMSITHCPHCGERREQEVKRPDGCICDAKEWSDPYNLPPVCDKFEADYIGGNCTRCEHDYGCHAEARSNASFSGKPACGRSAASDS